jgi:hypothetical protein
MDSNTTGTVISDENLKVIGLNGSILVACGASHPLVQRKDHSFCRYVVTAQTRTWLPESLFDQYLAEGRVSRLASPLSLPANYNEGTPIQPLAVFVNNDFTAAAEIQLPQWSRDNKVEWTDVVGEAIPTKATCQPTDVAHQWLNDWALKLCQKIDVTIASKHSLSEFNNDILLNWTHMALCAANDKSLRWKLHLRFGAFMAPERVRRTFDTFIQHEFPQCTWESYLHEMKNFRDVIQSQPIGIRATPEKTVNRIQKLHGITNIRPLELTFVV